MASTERSSKQIADRIEPGYYRHMHPMRLIRFGLSLGLSLVALAWVGQAYVRGDETIYANGPVAAAHALFETECRRCHEGQFQGAEDAFCRACHATPAHVDLDDVSDGPAEPACAVCHREHRGRTGLDAVPDAHCNTCHVQHRDYVDMDSHLDFEVQPHDQHLQFNHAVHLDSKLLEGPLDCGSCHEPEEGGHRAIAFADHCAHCHAERLDDELPDIRVPHGQQPEELRTWITATYLEVMRADGSLARHAGTGGVETPDWAQTLVRRSDAAMQGLLEPGRKRGCLICHTMIDAAIVPPAMPASWLAKARFDHRPHASQVCAACHEVANSRSADDLRLPGIANCRDCHRPDGASDACHTCHKYHR